jgi:hypothetical protein
MPKNDLVPCFYREQNALWEKPARLLPRSDVHELKRQNIGKFINNGKAFRLNQCSPATSRRFSPFRITKPGTFESHSSISFEEMEANLGIVEETVRNPRAVIMMAQEKVAWYPHVYDENAVLARGLWLSA